MSEEYKSIAYAIKDLQHQQRLVFSKILRTLRNHEKRLTRLEKHLNITPSPYEIDDSYELLGESNTTETTKGDLK